MRDSTGPVWDWRQEGWGGLWRRTVEYTLTVSIHPVFFQNLHAMLTRAL